MRAGHCVYGAESCEKGVKSGKVKLLILDGDVSENTRKRFGEICAYNGIEIIQLPESERMGRSIGKEHIKIAGITGSGFVKNILMKFKEGSDSSSE